MREPKVTISTNDDSVWRKTRLTMVYGFVCCALGGRVRQDLWLDDHKGWLTVHAEHGLRKKEQLAFIVAWGSEIGDGCDSSVTFTVASDRISNTGEEIALGMNQ